VFCVRVFLAQKKDAKIRVPANKTNPTTCMHSYQTKRGGAYYTSRSKTRPPSLANIHPSIHRTTTHYYYYRIETPTTIAGVKRERERERDNLLIVQRRRERKNFEGEKKKGEILSSAQLKCIRGIASSKPATTLITRRRRGSNRVSAVPPKRTRLRFGRSRSK